MWWTIYFLISLIILNIMAIMGELSNIAKGEHTRIEKPIFNAVAMLINSLIVFLLFFIIKGMW